MKSEVETGSRKSIDNAGTLTKSIDGATDIISDSIVAYDAIYKFWSTSNMIIVNIIMIIFYSHSRTTLVKSRNFYIKQRLI